MDIHVNASSRPCRVTLEGELTIYAVAELKDSLLAPIERYEMVEVDLAQVSDIDSAGLQLLILAKRHADRLDRKLHLVGHSQSVIALLELYDMAGFFGDPLVIPRTH